MQAFSSPLNVFRHRASQLLMTSLGGAAPSTNAQSYNAQEKSDGRISRAPKKGGILFLNTEGHKTSRKVQNSNVRYFGQIRSGNFRPSEAGLVRETGIVAERNRQGHKENC
jgi:hypothetical protein